ncbi:hypothetical protein AAFF_G00166160 [Aldrovandia affinis]|uniref:Uncharacterized protein n=1 Tax=Aldrovandia affinis TaxID=143900 RepID=A0AAD7RM42_9TELE|nr:hypothetical protein AAFF_G00166160 [Aldrovandia affinis]
MEVEEEEFKRAGGLFDPSKNAHDKGRKADGKKSLGSSTTGNMDKGSGRRVLESWEWLGTLRANKPHRGEACETSCVLAHSRPVEPLVRGALVCHARPGLQPGAGHLRAGSGCRRFAGVLHTGAFVCPLVYAPEEGGRASWHA